MAGLLPGNPSHHGMVESGPFIYSQDKPEEVGCWYLSRREIEEDSPSRRDGIDLKKETYLRKSYCTFLQDLGMRLKVPQVTIATAIIFCHRFFLRQSHAKNDRRTIATVCMFLAGKVEETPRPLKDVILVSYEIIHKRDPAAVQKIKQKEVYEQQKELILLGERVVLATLGFDLNVHHPYKPLVEAIKKFKVAQNALAQVAWNFVNDGLRTSLCLQFKPHHIAAGAIFLAAKFLKVKLPSDGEKVWWQEFDVTPRQLEGWCPLLSAVTRKTMETVYRWLSVAHPADEVSNQMLELYEQNRVPVSHGSEAEGSTQGGPGYRDPAETASANEEVASANGYAQSGGASKPGYLMPSTSKAASDLSPVDNQGRPQRIIQNQSNDYWGLETRGVILDHMGDGEIKDCWHPEQEPSYNSKDNAGEASNMSNSMSGQLLEEHEWNGGRSENSEAGKWKNEGTPYKPDSMSGQNLENWEGPLGQSSQDAIKKIDKDKVKAALEKRRKSRGDVARKMDLMDEDDLIERELEDGVELAAEDEKIKCERRQSWAKSANRLGHDNLHYGKDHNDIAEGGYPGGEGQSSRGLDVENVEEGEVSLFDDAYQGYQSPKTSSRMRKAGEPTRQTIGGKATA